MAEAACSMAICLIAISLLFESFCFLIKSEKNMQEISNKKRCMYSVKREIESEITFEKISKLFQGKGDTIQVPLEESILQRLCTDDFYNILLEKSESNIELLNQEKDQEKLIITLKKVESSSNYMKIKLILDMEGRKKEEIIYKSSWLDYV